MSAEFFLEALSPSQDESSLLGIIIYEVCKSFLFALPIIPPIQETLGLCLLSEWMNWGSEWFMGPLYSRGLYCMCCLYFRACRVTLDITGIAASLSITKFYLLWNCANASQLSRWRCLLPQVRSSFFYSTWTIGGLLSEEQNWGLKRLLSGCYLILPMWWVPSDFFGWAPRNPRRAGLPRDTELQKMEFYWAISFSYHP